MLKTGILFLILFLLPVSLEILVESIRGGKKKSLAYLWTRGLVWEWGLFAGSYMIMQFGGEYSFHFHWLCFLALSGAAGVIGWVLCFIKGCRVLSLKQHEGSWRPAEILVRAAVTAGVILLCWINVNQSEFLKEDTTIETMNTVLEHNTAGSYDPRTGIEYSEGQEARPDPALVVFWAGLSWCADLHPAELLNVYLAPVFMLLFYMLSLEAGRQLLGSSGMKAEMFTAGIMLLHVFGAARQWLPFYQLENGPWMPEHILSWFLLPLLILEIFKWIQLKKRTYQAVYCALLGAAAALLADTGWYYVLVSFVLGAAVYLGRKVWKC